MKSIILLFLIVFFAGGVFSQETLTVTVVSSAAGTGITEIEYTFNGDDEVYNISAEVSFDNGGNFQPIPDVHLAGALTNVAPGGPYSLTWDGRASFPETFSDETIIKLEATAVAFICGNNLTFTYRGSEVTYGSIERVGICWFDRNLGADPMPFVPADDATGNTDARLFGDLFQWGRGDDGHQVRDPLSPATNTLSTTDQPGHGKFIRVFSEPGDWREERNDDLWQGVDGINNPCPPGWRLPIAAELDAERVSWNAFGVVGAYASPLKWPVGGNRSTFGSLDNVGDYAGIWSSSIDDYLSEDLFIYPGGAIINDSYRVVGLSVRCVRDI